MGWYWHTMKVCGSKPLSIKPPAPIINRTGKVSLSFLYPPGGDKSVDLKIDGYDAAGRPIQGLELLVLFTL